MLSRLVLHALVLALSNLIGIWLGFMVHAIVRGPDQIAVQLPIASVVSIATFLVWIAVATERFPRRFRVDGAGEWCWIFALAMFWSAAIFVLVHYLTQGYLTSFSNVRALWRFQAAANLVAVGIAATVVARRDRRADRSADVPQDGSRAT
ncbi:MAG: hypothetical protein RBT60_13445 [Candidatus Krumholzibacteria bacterium]|jgi:ABC-type multidrug transport system permease subunit|nr:hypothetical protein [Candidatus Krumholzibacteria bacterium]